MSDLRINRRMDTIYTFTITWENMQRLFFQHMPEEIKPKNRVSLALLEPTESRKWCGVRLSWINKFQEHYDKYHTVEDSNAAIGLGEDEQVLPPTMKFNKFKTHRHRLDLTCADLCFIALMGRLDEADLPNTEEIQIEVDSSASVITLKWENTYECVTDVDNPHPEYGTEIYEQDGEAMDENPQNIDSQNIDSQEEDF